MKLNFASLLLFIMPAVAIAHHSRSHYPDEVQELVGELVAVHWVNPHVGFTLKVVNEAGQIEEWRVEGATNLGSMRRGGVEEDFFTLGEQVTFLGSVSIRRDRDMLVSNVLLENGTEILLSTNVPLHWSDDDVIEYSPRATETGPVDAASENRGLYRIWSNVPDFVGQTTDFSFTDFALAARAEWDEIDSFAERCEPEGMPRIMRNPHPFEFVDEGSQIRMISELYDLERIIYMNDVAPPASAFTSSLGYSTGRWEGRTLIVTTSRINWPYFDNIGTPQTEEAEIVERFTLSEDQARLDYRFTSVDPTVFSRPAVYERYWVALGEDIEPYNCTVY
jgi:hypothetical protein